MFSTETLFKPYFCLDTSLDRTLAYAHRWCGECLEIVNIYSHSRLHSEIASAVCVMTLHWISSSFKCSGPVQYLQQIVAETFFGPTLDSKF